MSFAVGALVRARGREWVVQSDSTDGLLMLRPLSGGEDETTGICPDLESVTSATFDLPDPTRMGDEQSCRLLRDAVRIGFRSSAGPFRCIGNLAVDPRPYQLVPLLMALKLDPVRLLIADDVGIGKTVEAALIARELLDRAEVKRMAVLCPPHLVEQWQEELDQKFHIKAELVTSGNIAKLERNCRHNESVFDVYPYVIVSIDFIKSERRKKDFLRAAPELVLIDEAHTCAFGEERGRQLRYELVSRLAENADRHLILITATPHSGKEQAFRSLLKFLNPEFANLPENLAGFGHEEQRRALAAHFVQRRRADIRHYLETDTSFPDRMEKEVSYNLSPAYAAFFDKVIRYTRRTVGQQGLQGHQSRVRWWSALAMLRALGSSPAAAAATFRTRADGLSADSEVAMDQAGYLSVMDLMDSEMGDSLDTAPGADFTEGEADASERKTLLALAREAEQLQGKEDAKLTEAIRHIKALLKDGFAPIVFCRFIDTAEYVEAAMREALPNTVETAVVTGLLPPLEREQRVLTLTELKQAGKKVLLICTDCLSEGINLQQGFDAVLHYDLSWNPTRHEQREGRVDRFGQPSKTVRVLRYYGKDNKIDGIVLDVLLRKHDSIRSSLGISVPVPVKSEELMAAIFEGLLLREQGGAGEQLMLSFFEPEKERLHEEWESVKEREKVSRTLFAQLSIKPDDVAAELRAARDAIGSGAELQTFVDRAFRLHGAVVTSEGSLKFNVSECPRQLRDMVGFQKIFKARFDLPVNDGEVYLSRTSPVVEGLASYVMETAFDPASTDSRACRCGVIHTEAVTVRTSLVLVRYRYHILKQRGDETVPLLAEECVPLAFRGAPDRAEWLGAEETEALLQARSTGNETLSTAQAMLERMLEQVRQGALDPELESHAVRRADELLAAHRRVRDAARLTHVKYRVEPKLPADILGMYVYLPK